MNDIGQSATYAAEHELHSLLKHASAGCSVQVAGSTLTLPVERLYGQVEDVQRYVDKVMNLSWVKQTWPNAGVVKVRGRRGARQAHYEPGIIAIPGHEVGGTWAMRETVVLHELAHHLTLGHGHDALFRGTLLTLLGELIGAEVAFALSVAFAQNNVPATPVELELVRAERLAQSS